MLMKLSRYTRPEKTLIGECSKKEGRMNKEEVLIQVMEKSKMGLSKGNRRIRNGRQCRWLLDDGREPKTLETDSLRRKTKHTPCPLVRKRTVPTVQPPLFDEI
jgi:hypothetical protein